MNFSRKIKSLITLLLLVLIVFHFNGQFVVFKVLEYRIKKEIKTKIKMGVAEEELIVLKIPKSLEENPNKDFHRIHEKEFRFKGEMYDVVKKYEKDDTTFYYCIHDKEETLLFANLGKLIKNEFGNPEKKKDINRYTNLISSFYYKSDTEFLQNPFCSQFKFITPDYHLTTTALSPSTPPPELTP
jgi:hypothetical protein